MRSDGSQNQRHLFCEDSRKVCEAWRCRESPSPGGGGSAREARRGGVSWFECLECSHVTASNHRQLSSRHGQATACQSDERRGSSLAPSPSLADLRQSFPSPSPDRFLHCRFCLHGCAADY